MSITFCIGKKSEDLVCEKRETCKRYIKQIDDDSIYAWYMAPQIPGPCEEYLPTERDRNVY